MIEKGTRLSFTKAVALKETGANLEVTGIRAVKYVQDQVHNSLQIMIW